MASRRGSREVLTVDKADRMKNRSRKKWSEKKERERLGTMMAAFCCSVASVLKIRRTLDHLRWTLIDVSSLYSFIYFLHTRNHYKNAKKVEVDDKNVLET